MKKDNFLDELLKGLNLKLTKPRKTIARIILTTFEHLSVEDVLQRAKKEDPKIGIATVYRTLALLEENNLIRKHGFKGFPATFENICNKAHHDHLIDLDDSTVVEFIDNDLEKIIHRIAKDKGYELLFHDIRLYGKKIS